MKNNPTTVILSWWLNLGNGDMENHLYFHSLDYTVHAMCFSVWRNWLILISCTHVHTHTGWSERDFTIDLLVFFNGKEFHAGKHKPWTRASLFVLGRYWAENSLIPRPNLSCTLHTHRQIGGGYFHYRKLVPVDIIMVVSNCRCCLHCQLPVA